MTVCKRPRKFNLLVRNYPTDIEASWVEHRVHGRSEPKDFTMEDGLHDHATLKQTPQASGTEECMRFPKHPEEPNHTVSEHLFWDIFVPITAMAKFNGFSLIESTNAKQDSIGNAVDSFRSEVAEHWLGHKPRCTY